MKIPHLGVPVFPPILSDADLRDAPHNCPTACHSTFFPQSILFLLPVKG